MLRLILERTQKGRVKEKPDSLWDFLRHSRQSVGKNINSTGHFDEFSDRNEYILLETGRGVILATEQQIAWLVCACIPVLWEKVEFKNYELGYLGEKSLRRLFKVINGFSSPPTV